MSKILSIDDIFNLLAQRKRLLMVDRAKVIDKKTIVGIKNVTANEPYFTGHFPNNPIMPGILQFECMLQLANILIKNNDSNQEFYFPQTIEKIRFKRPITPGDQITTEVKLEKSDNVTKVSASLKVNSKVCSQGNFTIAPSPPEKFMPKSLFNNNFPKKIDNDVVFNSTQINEILPHRYPFNFVDDIIYLSEDQIIGKKLISSNEGMCLQHKNCLSYLPHSYVIEAVAQVACTVALVRNRGKIALFLSVDNCKIKRFATPGDTLFFDIKELFRKTSLGRCIATVYAGDEEIMSLEIAYAIADKQ